MQTIQKHGPAVIMLKAMIKAARGVRGLEQKPIIDANLVKMADDTVMLGVETVTITYALYRITAELPKMAKTAERKSAVEALRAQVDEKNVTLGDDMNARFQELEDPSFKAEG